MFGLIWIDNGWDETMGLIRRIPNGQRVIFFVNDYYGYVEDMKALGWWHRPEVPDLFSDRRANPKFYGESSARDPLPLPEPS